MKADMHIHSRYSDGGLWPTQIIELAKQKGLEIVCITDHESLGSCEETMIAAEKNNIITWPAVEIDCEDNILNYHSEILAYFPNKTYSNTQNMLDTTCKIRAEGIKKVFERVSDYFSDKDLSIDSIIANRLSNKPDGLENIDESKFRFSKTDVYLALKARKHIPEDMLYKEFKHKYFEKGIFADVSFPKPSLEAVADIVAKDKGILVIPHIAHEFDDNYAKLFNNTDKLDKILRRFYSLGVRGTELYHYRNNDSKAINKLVKRHSREIGYFNSYGSDSHGPGSKRDDLGDFYGDFFCFPSIDLPIYKKSKKNRHHKHKNK